MGASSSPEVMEPTIDSRPDVALGLTCDDSKLAEPPEVGVGCTQFSHGIIGVSVLGTVVGLTFDDCELAKPSEVGVGYAHFSQGAVEVSTAVPGTVMVVSTVS